MSCPAVAALVAAAGCLLATPQHPPGHVLTVLIAESALIAVAVGIVGSLGARYILGSFDLNAMTMGFIPVFDVKWGTVALAAGISLAVAFASTIVPAWSASRIAIAEAVRRRGE